jgi:hypothetical protein
MGIKEKVKSIIDAQQEKGFNKYGVYVDDADLSPEEWIEHAPRGVDRTRTGRTSRHDGLP